MLLGSNPAAIETKSWVYQARYSRSNSSISSIKSRTQEFFSQRTAGHLWTPKPWKMKGLVLGPVNIWVITPQNEGCGFPWHFVFYTAKVILKCDEETQKHRGVGFVVCLGLSKTGLTCTKDECHPFPSCSLEQWKKGPWLFRVLRGLYYPDI